MKTETLINGFHGNKGFSVRLSGINKPLPNVYITNIIIHFNKNLFRTIEFCINGKIISKLYPSDITNMSALFNLHNDEESFQLPISGLFNGNYLPYNSFTLCEIFIEVNPDNRSYSRFNVTYDLYAGYIQRICDMFPILQYQYYGKEIVDYLNSDNYDELKYANIHLSFNFQVIFLHLSFDMGSILDNIETISMYSNNNNLKPLIWSKQALAELYKTYNTGILPFFPPKSSIERMLLHAINFSYYSIILSITFLPTFDKKNNNLHISCTNVNAIVLDNGAKNTSYEKSYDTTKSLITDDEVKNIVYRKSNGVTICDMFLLESN